MNTSITFNFSEIEAVRLVPMDAYDEAGNVVGPNPDYDKHCAEVDGMTVFRTTMIHGTDQLTIQSKHCLPAERNDAMAEMMKVAGDIAFKRIFGDPR